MHRSTTGARLAEPAATACALVACVAARLPQHVLSAAGITGWAVSLIVVVLAVNGALAAARAPFTYTPDRSSISWLGGELKKLVLIATVGAGLTLPLYALLRATPAWWLLAWMTFSAVTVIGQVAMPLLLRAQSGPLASAPPSLAERVRALGRRAGVDVGRGVSVAGAEDAPDPGRPRRCNAYVVGLGPTRRVVLERTLAGWPPDLVDQVVAHEIGHWRLGHTVRRLPLAILTQLATFALAAWLLSRPQVLHLAGVAHAGDPASYPFLLLLTPALVLPARCLLAWRDRVQEREADAFALSLLGDPRTFAAMLDRAADDGGAPRELSPWRRLTASHPPIDERALACTRFASTA